MGRIILILALLLAPSLSFAGQWCEWDGSQGINCQSDSRGYILINGFKVKTPAIANDAGYYLTETTYPTLGTNQVRDVEQWSFDGTTISRTWTVRDMTQTEIDEREAQAMDIGQYYLWKALLAKGVITQQEAANALPQELIDAYQAREALNQ